MRQSLAFVTVLASAVMAADTISFYFPGGMFLHNTHAWMATNIRRIRGRRPSSHHQRSPTLHHKVQHRLPHGRRLERLRLGPRTRLHHPLQHQVRSTNVLRLYLHELCLRSQHIGKGDDMHCVDGQPGRQDCGSEGH